MATAQLSILVDRIAGKSGRAIFSEGRTGLQVKGHRKPKNPRSAAQVQVRTFFARAASMWRVLTSTEVQAWRDYAIAQETGEEAFSIFMGLACKYQQIHAYLQTAVDIPRTPPTAPFQGDAVTFAATVSSHTITITPTGTSTSGVITEILIQRLASKNRTPDYNAYRTQAFVEFVDADDYPFVVSPGTYALATRFTDYATGQATLLTPLGTVTAT